MAYYAKMTERTKTYTNKDIDRYNHELKILKAVLEEFREKSNFYDGGATYFNIRNKKNMEKIHVPSVYIYRTNDQYLPIIYMTENGSLVRSRDYAKEQALYILELGEANSVNIPQVVNELEYSITGLLLSVINTAKQKGIALSTPGLERYRNAKDNEIEHLSLIFGEYQY